MAIYLQCGQLKIWSRYPQNEAQIFAFSHNGRQTLQDKHEFKHNGNRAAFFFKTKFNLKNPGKATHLLQMMVKSLNFPNCARRIKIFF